MQITISWTQSLQEILNLTPRISPFSKIKHILAVVCCVASVSVIPLQDQNKLLCCSNCTSTAFLQETNPFYWINQEKKTMLLGVKKMGFQCSNSIQLELQFHLICTVIPKLNCEKQPSTEPRILSQIWLNNCSPLCCHLRPSSSFCPSVWVAVGPVLRWIPMVRRSICEPYLILLICLQNKKRKGTKKQKIEEGGKTREKVSLSFWGADRPRPNELKDVNNILALPLDPFLCQILERNEAKFSPLLKGVVRDVRRRLPPLLFLWVFVQRRFVIHLSRLKTFAIK